MRSAESGPVQRDRPKCAQALGTSPIMQTGLLTPGSFLTKELEKGPRMTEDRHRLSDEELTQGAYPIIKREEDGSWVGWYPEQAVRYRGATREAVVQQLPIRRVRCHPHFRYEKGSWLAWYPGLECEVRAPSQELARDLLIMEQRHRMASDPGFVARFNYLRENPPEGWEVIFQTREEHGSWLAQRSDHARNSTKGEGTL